MKRRWGGKTLGHGIILSERDALRTRVRILEAAIECIEREADRALVQPDIAFVVTRRVSSVARQAYGELSAESARPRPRKCRVLPSQRPRARVASADARLKSRGTS